MNKKLDVATIYDVAKRAKVSKTTVSRVLNGEASVSQQTRAQVKKAMKALHYMPNKAARNLASKSEMRIGLLYNNPSVAYFSELLIGALDGCGRRGVQLVVDKCEVSDPAAARKAIDALVQSGIGGMLLTAPISSSLDIIRALHRKGVMSVAVATGRPRTDITCVGIDDYAAAREMTAYLIAQGHRSIGFVKGHPGHSSSLRRYDGFRAAMREAGLSISPSLIAQGENSYRSGLFAGEEILSRSPRPTAIFASNDDMASAVMSVAHRSGLTIPQDLSVVGFDDTIAGSIWPALTTIRQPIFDIGAKAIDVLVQDIHALRAGTTPKVQCHLIPHSLIIRESVRKIEPAD